MTWLNRVHFGDCRKTMRELVAGGGRVQTIVTSPPYWGLRDYGHPGQLGLERTPEEYVANMVEVFRAARDLLADDGTLWLNLGDCYAGNGGQFPQMGALFKGRARQRDNVCLSLRGAGDGLKAKDLVGIPWMVAFALRADGWYLRQEIIWSKPNPMPESVTDRCTKAHEYIFLLSKSPRYYYDADAIAEPVSPSMLMQIEQGYNGKATKDFASGGAQDASATKSRIIDRARASWKGSSFDDGKTGEMMETRGGLKKSGNKERKPSSERGCPEGTGKNQAGSVPWEGVTRNKRSVWTVTTKPYAGAHFATFPPDLIEPCILAGSKPGDVVFDPFMGSGTTAEVAQRLGRQWVGCELNPEYEPLQRQRTQQLGMAI